MQWRIGFSKYFALEDKKHYSHDIPFLFLMLLLFNNLFHYSNVFLNISRNNLTIKSKFRLIMAIIFDFIGQL